MLAFTPTTDPQEIQARREYLARLYSTYSDTGRGYRSLNKTLANFRHLIHKEPLLVNLKYIHLAREIKDPLELMTLLYAIEESRKFNTELAPLWQRAARAQIEKAMRIVLPAGDRDNIASFVLRLMMYEPEGYQGSVITLARLAKQSVARDLRRIREKIAARLGKDTKLPQPSVLPKIKGVTFIATIGELLQETLSMDNCSMDYAEQAVSGECYFFRVEKNGDRATCRVSREGIETDGPRHKPNAATQWQWWVDAAKAERSRKP